MGDTREEGFCHWIGGTNKSVEGGENGLEMYMHYITGGIRGWLKNIFNLLIGNKTILSQSSTYYMNRPPRPASGRSATHQVVSRDLPLPLLLALRLGVDVAVAAVVVFFVVAALLV